MWGQVGKQQQNRYVHNPHPEWCSCVSPIPVKVNFFVKHSLGGDGRFSTSHVSYLVEFICSHSSNFCFYWLLLVPLVQIVFRGALKIDLSWAAGRSSSAKYLCYLTCFPSHVIFLSCMKIHVKPRWRNWWTYPYKWKSSAMSCYDNALNRTDYLGSVKYYMVLVFSLLSI